MKTPTPSGKFWAYTGATAGGLVSIAANVVHSFIPPTGAPTGWHPELGAVIGAATWPVFLFIAVEILARVTWPHGWGWRLGRFGGLIPVAAVAALVSYRHLSGLLAHYGEEPIVYTVGPLAVDGLMVMATAALLATSRHHTAAPAPETPPARATTAASAAPHSDHHPATKPTAATEPTSTRAGVPKHLVGAARFAVTNHEQTTGQPITVDELAARIGVTTDTAHQLLTHLNPNHPANTAGRVNGATITAGAR